ncbi:hypothetical protein [Tsukamurella pseudospumae]|nr:hypothetical protein [Tsukamurella pseudospumae]
MRERFLEWTLDDAMRSRIRRPATTYADIHVHVEVLQRYRLSRNIRGRLDERVGRALDIDERVVVDRLLREGRNVTVLARSKSGSPTPDIAVDGEPCEIKTSTNANAKAFGRRVADVRQRQGTGRVFVNAMRSGIPTAELAAEMKAVVEVGDATYIRIIAREVDQEYGRWS